MRIVFVRALFSQLCRRLRTNRPTILLAIITDRKSAPQNVNDRRTIFTSKAATNAINNNCRRCLTVRTKGRYLTRRRSTFHHLVLRPGSRRSVGTTYNNRLAIFYRCLSPTRPKLLSLLSTVLRTLHRRATS